MICLQGEASPAIATGDHLLPKKPQHVHDIASEAGRKQIVSASVLFVCSAAWDCHGRGQRIQACWQVLWDL